MPNQPASSLPSSTIDAYGRVLVQLDAPLISVTVSVQRYACQTPGYGTGQVDRMTYKDRLLGAIGGVRGIAREGMTVSGFVGVFSGKGTMDDIARCLRVAARHRIFHHTRPALPQSAQIAYQSALQGVVDAYIGMDCNGFVGNWAIYNSVPGASASFLPLDWLSGRAQRMSLSEIQPYDIAVWASGVHIGMIESVTALAPGARSRDVGFAESSSGGMRMRTGTQIKLASTPTNAARGGWRTSFLLKNEIHHDSPVVIASMARSGR
jgi:hypothetical protein